MRILKLILLPLVCFSVSVCSKTTKSPSSNIEEPLVRFTNESDYPNAQITKYRHTRGEISIFKQLNQYVKKGDTVILPNLIDGDNKAFRDSDRVEVTFECYQTNPERWCSGKADATVNGNIRIVCTGHCSHKTLFAKATLSVSTDKVNFEAGRSVVSFEIENMGEEPLNWTISKSEDDWFAVSPTSGTNDATITVTAYRDSIKTLGQYKAEIYIIGDSSEDTVDVSILCGTDGLKPFSFPDRWDDADQDSLWDMTEPYDPNITGYEASSKVGDQMVLKLRSSVELPKACYYYAVCFGQIGSDMIYTGADSYRRWICEESEPFIISPGDQLYIEAGSMKGPTVQGLKCLIDLDSTATWDSISYTVVNSVYPISPRIIKVPVFDPTLDGQNCVTISKVLILYQN